jgi:short-subunit dehydrogenase
MDSPAEPVKDGADAAESLRPAIVVTGASTGIGRAIALVAAAEGELLLVARSLDKLDSLAREVAAAGGRSHALALDLTEPGAADVVARALAQRSLYCDVLVNNAGFGLNGPAAVLDRAAQLDLVDLNMRALTDLTLTFLPGMIARRRGGVIHMASVASYTPGPGMAAYYASKAYVRSFSEALWEECRGAGVTITAVCPGPVDTPFFARATGRRRKPRLFELLPGEDAASVARKGWRGFRAGRRVVIPGLAAKAAVLAARILPARLLLRVLRKLQKRRSAPMSRES